MPRKPRVEFEGAVYHVMCRGDHAEPIYQDDADRQAFLACLEEACAKTEWRVHAYVLMDNHYHVLLETPQANLVAGMHWLQGTYTGRYNRRHRLHGHLFQGRYKPLLIEPDDDQYFLHVSSYIHLNPVRAKIVDAARAGLESYRWSSFPGYAAPRRRPGWLCVQRVLAALELRDTPGGRRKYRVYLGEQARQVLHPGPGVGADLRQQAEAIRRGWCLGSEGFRQRMKQGLDRLFAEHRRASYGGAAVAEHRSRSADELLNAALAAAELAGEDLASLRKTDPRKQAVAWLLRKHSTASNRWVSERLQMGHEVNVSQAVRRVEIARHGALAGWKRAVRSTLTSKD